MGLGLLGRVRARARARARAGVGVGVGAEARVRARVRLGVRGRCKVIERSAQCCARAKVCAARCTVGRDARLLDSGLARVRVRARARARVRARVGS